MGDRKICHFTDLIAWQRSKDLIERIYEITKDFPREELFGLTSQLRRAAVSIGCNIAEGFGRFHYKDKIKFYYQARGSNTEVENLLIISKTLGYLQDKDFIVLRDLTNEGYRLLNGLINSTGKSDIKT